MSLKHLSGTSIGRPPKLDRSNAENVFATKLYDLVEVRNNWSQIDTAYSLKNWGNFSTTKEDLVSKVERVRKQGSRYLIQETPAIAISSENHALIICMALTRKPFEDWQPKSQNKTIAGIYKSLTQDGFPDNVAVFFHQQRDEKIHPLSLPLWSHYSISRGADYYLHWRPVPSNRGVLGNRNLWNLQYLYDSIAKITMSLQVAYENE